jgi:tetratricopeptide (TPR) repeat protein
MRHFLKILTVLTAGAYFLFTGCNNQQEDVAFDEILTRPPFASLTDSIRTEPRRDELYFRRAVLLNKENFPEPALKDFNKAWSLQKDERYALGVSTILLDRNPDSAIHFLNAAIKHVPNSILLQLTLARAYEAKGKIDEALLICDNILKINPVQVDVLKIKAGLMDKKGNPAESLSILEKAYGVAPYDLELNHELAYKYAETKNPRVLQLCDSLIKQDSLKMYAEPYYYKGIYYSNINEKQKAISLFDQAVQQDYYFLNAYIEKGRVLFDLKKFNEAFKVFNLAMTISPRFADSYYWMGRCQEELGQKEEAKLNYQRAFGLDKTFTQAKEAADRIK